MACGEMPCRSFTLRPHIRMDIWTALDYETQQNNINIDHAHNTEHEDDLRTAIRQKYDSLTGEREVRQLAETTLSETNPTITEDRDAHLRNTQETLPVPSFRASEISTSTPIRLPGPQAAIAPVPGQRQAPLAARNQTPLCEDTEHSSSAVSEERLIGEPLIERLQRKKQKREVLESFEAFQASIRKQQLKLARHASETRDAKGRSTSYTKPRGLASSLLNGVSVCIPPAYPHLKKHENWWSIVSCSADHEINDPYEQVNEMSGTVTLQATTSTDYIIYDGKTAKQLADALGVASMSEIPSPVRAVRWDWVASCKRNVSSFLSVGKLNK